MPLPDEPVFLPQRGDDALTLGDYIAVVWRYKWIVVAAALGAGLLMLAESVTATRVYESTVTFAATQSKIGEGTAVSTATTAGFRPMIESLTTAAAVLKDVGLDKKIRPAEFLDDIMTVSEVRGTNLMRVTVVYPDPVLAATMANKVADRAVKVARKVSATEAEHARDMIKLQLDEARSRLDSADKAERAYKQKAQVEAVKADVTAQLSGRGELLDLVVSIASEKAKLERMEQDLATRSRVDTLNKSEAGAPAGSQRSESINPVYQQLDTEIAASRGQLASLQKQRAELIDVRKLNGNQLASLNHLYEIEGELARLQIERDLAERIYTDISQRYEVASLQVVGRSAELSVIDEAVPADRPLSRQVVRNTVIAGVVGCCFALAGILLWFTATHGRRLTVR